MSETEPQPAPSPIDDEQLQLLLESIEQVAASPAGCGEVLVTIRDGKITFIQPAPSLDARSARVASSRTWLWRMRRRPH